MGPDNASMEDFMRAKGEVNERVFSVSYAVRAMAIVFGLSSWVITVRQFDFLAFLGHVLLAEFVIESIYRAAARINRN